MKCKSIIESFFYKSFKQFISYAGNGILFMDNLCLNVYNLTANANNKITNKIITYNYENIKTEKYKKVGNFPNCKFEIEGLKGDSGLINHVFEGLNKLNTIEDRNKLFYIRGLKEYQLNNEKGYLIDTCLNSQDNYRKLVEFFLEEDK